MSATTLLTDNLVSLAASGSGMPWKTLGIIGVLGVIGYAVWYFFFRKKKGAD